MHPILVANWKMYKTIQETLSFIDTISSQTQKSRAEVLLAVPFTAIHEAAKKATGSKIEIGAQNMNDAAEGAYTGEVAARMLKDAGASFVIVGHSERRRYFDEQNSVIQKKVQRALQSGLQCILCIGETAEEREGNATKEVIEGQLIECLNGLSSPDNLIIAYEPVWAIGTGKPATAQIAEEAHHLIRTVLISIWSEEKAEKVPLLYGGSVTAGNAQEFLQQKNINGLLIGSASLQPESFAKIIQVSDNIP